MKVTRVLVLIFGGLFLSNCVTSQPSNIDNCCDILKEKRGWYKALKASEKRYGTPMRVQIAIVKQESSFKHDAKPEREYVLGFIPWFRKSSAYGYAQAKDETWDWYRRETGNRWADRNDFEDAVDFIGWYTNLTQRTLGISKWDAYNQYLAYHEGHGGYRRGTYKEKAWLMRVARKVEQTAKEYGAQLKECEKDLDKGFWFWPF